MKDESPFQWWVITILLVLVAVLFEHGCVIHSNRHRIEQLEQAQEPSHHEHHEAIKLLIDALDDAPHTSLDRENVS